MDSLFLIGGTLIVFGKKIIEKNVPLLIIVIMQFRKSFG